jgi:hypothetical protein
MLCLIGVQNQNLFFSKHESLVEILLPIHVRSAAYIAPHTDRGRERRGQRVNCVQKIALKNFPNRYVNFRSGLRGNVAALVTMPNSMARGLHADCCLWDTKTLADALFGSAPNTGRGRGTRRVTRSRRRYVHRKHCARVTRARSDGRPPGGSGCSRRQILTRSGHTNRRSSQAFTRVGMMFPRRPHWTPREICELSGLTCFVVDDDDDVVDMLATLLGRYGVHLVRARTGDDAVAYVDTAPNHIVQIRPAPSRHLYLRTAARPLRQWWGRRLRGH